MFVDQWELYRSLTCYLLTVPEDTKKTSVQIYKDWKRTVCYHMDASIVPVLLEYIAVSYTHLTLPTNRLV